MLKSNYYLRLPLSALAFYLFLLSLIGLGILPTLPEIYIMLRELYNILGLPGLFVGSFLEGIAYLGLYFPGSLIIAFAVVFSNGTLIEFAQISGIVSLAITIASFINYYFGKYSVLNYFLKPKQIKNEEKKAINSSFLSCFLHPNMLAFYVYTMGARGERIWRLFLIPLILFPFGFFCAYLIYLVRDSFVEAMENPYIMIGMLFTWFFVVLFWNLFKEHKVGKKKNE